MNRRALAALLALSLVPSLSHTRSWAQPAADEATTKAARTRFQEGVRAFDKGHYEAARAAFLQAYALKKHPAVLLNLAQSCLQSGRPLEAARYFQQFLRESKDASPAQKEAATQGLVDARQKLLVVEVSAPPGTDVYVDGERVGTAPLSEPVDVEAGSHAVKARGEGGREESQTITGRAGERTAVKFAPPPPPEAPPAPVAAPAPAAVPPQPAASAPPAAPTTPQSAQPSPGLFSPPKAMAPVWIAGGLSLVGFGVGIGFGIQRNAAQNNATKVEQEIYDAGGTTSTCTSNDPATVRRFGEACQVLADDMNLVNTNATVSNVGFIVGGVSAAAAIGWYLFAPKQHAPTTSVGRPTLVPVFGPEMNGLAVIGSLR